MSIPKFTPYCLKFCLYVEIKLFTYTLGEMLIGYGG